MAEQKPDLNVYGHNLPEERCVNRPGIREQGTAEQLDGIRDRRSGDGGGMGRRDTPRDGRTQGQWRHDDNVEMALDDHPELDETPMPPRHAPLSDEVPS
jgi:hypothetical protein